MRLEFRFAVVSDLHITLPHTLWDHPSRFHLAEVSIPAFEAVLEDLGQQALDFLLLPGDLTQHGERDNHAWLSQRLAQLPFPVYVIPGNHDGPSWHGNERTLGLEHFAAHYQQFGYQDPTRLYYSRELLPGVRLIALNSNDFDPDGQLVGRLDPAQLAWLEDELRWARQEWVLVMVHHNVVEHLRGQSLHPWGKRYILRNASQLLRILRGAGVEMVFTGHLHVQNIAARRGVYDITTGSLVSYPHPYRILHFCGDADGRGQLQIVSRRVERIPGWPTLQQTSREWMGERSIPTMRQFLASPPLGLSLPEAEPLVADLRYLWADIAAGDALLQFPHFPDRPRHYLEQLNGSICCQKEMDSACSDNHTTLQLQRIQSH